MSTTQAIPTRSPFAPIQSFRESPTRTVVSIFPLPLSKQIPLAGMLYTFQIPAQLPRKYFALEVGSSYQLIPDVSDVDENNPVPGMRAAPVTATQLADALVTDWTNSVTRQGAPGVGVLPVGVTEGGAGWSEFIARLTDQQRLMAEWLVQDASDKHIKGDTKNITTLHREMAKWLLGDQSSKLSWFPQHDFNGNKRCIACDKEIRSQAKVCEHCKTDIVDYYVKYGLDATTDPAIMAQVNRMREALKAQRPSLPAKASAPADEPAVTQSPERSEDGETSQPNHVILEPELRKFQVTAEILTKVLDKCSADEKREYQRLSNRSLKDGMIRKLAIERDVCDEDGVIKEQ